MLSRHGTLHYRNGSSVTKYEIDDTHNATIAGKTYTMNDAYMQFDPSAPNKTA